MTVTNRKKRNDIRSPCLLVACNLINKQNVSEQNFSTSPDSCYTNLFYEDRSPMTLPTPDDSTASWLDADDSYQVADFFEESSRILHDEDDFSDAFHDRLRFEYEQWKKIPHLRIIGKRIDCPRENNLEVNQQSCQVVGEQTTTAVNNAGNLNLLRDQVIKIMTETLWKRILDKSFIKGVCQRRSVSESRQPSRIESTLTVSSILPTNRPPNIVFKSRSHLKSLNQNELVYHGLSNRSYNKKPCSETSPIVLPPIEIHQKKPVDKTKRWFSAIGTPGRNCNPPRPVTSVSTHIDTAVNSFGPFPPIDVCFNISIAGKGILSSKKNSKKKGYCSPS
ncbi:Hypothetical protein CINCED_3A009053 [Cinara cedri]|uniref:Uncharacterized protein n=1 Tax=Cinara cedri TaxID=506608 RepID=A0A5E4MGJ5_9HEMI|nr:Hypothetical protein CINCED_3A009053 [Cinara cedri]